MKAGKRTAPTEAPAAVEAEPAEMQTEPVELPYRVGSWCGFAHYECRQCPFDTLEEGAMLEHVAGHMVAEQAPVRSGTVLVADKYGHEIE